MWMMAVVVVVAVGSGGGGEAASEVYFGFMLLPNTEISTLNHRANDTHSYLSCTDTYY
jgi:hypothetical protein